MAPDGWHTRTVGSLLADVRTGTSVRSAGRPCVGNEVGVLKTSAVTYGQFLAAEHKAVLTEDLGRVRAPVQGNTILVSRMNTLSLVGASVFVPRDYPNLYLPDRIWQLTAHSDTADARWLQLVLSSPRMRDAISDVASGTSGSMKNVAQSRFLALPVLVPQLSEQRKIAAILSAVDDVIAKTEIVIETLQTLKKAMMQELLGRGLPGRQLRFKQTEIGEMPEGWDLSALDTLVEPGRPICYGILMPGSGHPGGVPVIKVKNIKEGTIDQSDLLLTTPDIDSKYARSRVRAGDVLLTIRGTTGRLARVPAELANANITQDTARISVKAGVNVDYIFHALHSLKSQTQIHDYTRGQAVKGINIADVRKLLVPVPTPDEQAGIASVFEAVDHAALQTRQEQDAHKTLKSALMSVLLTGELRIIPDESAA